MNHDDDTKEINTPPTKGEIVVETPHGHYIVRFSHSDGGFVAWTLDYERLVGHWQPPCTLCEVKADLNAGISKM